MAVSKIEWTQMVWNPVRGCSMAKGSEKGGCLNCYAARWQAGPYKHVSPTTGEPFAVMRDSGPRWTGKVELIESMPDIPLRRKKPTTYFVNSMSDLFHESLPDEAIDRVFAAMALCPQHTFQVLTKRADRMLRWTTRTRGNHCIEAIDIGTGRVRSGSWIDPIENVWLGVSCEDQKAADERIPLLLQTPAAVRFVSLEPLLGPVNLGHVMWGDCEYDALTNGRNNDGCRLPHLDWVIVGGESGPGARPMHPDWARSIRDQCVEASVSFFFKQWGEWSPHLHPPERGKNTGAGLFVLPNGRSGNQGDYWDGNAAAMDRVGKKAAGHLLDGQEWRQMPEARAHA